MSQILDNENFFEKFPVELRRNFEELFLNGSIGFFPITISDVAFVKTFKNCESTFCYHYILKIPFAGHKLSWGVIFAPGDLSLAPNFNFDDDNFYLSEDLKMITDSIPSWVNWNVDNPKALLSVLQEFVKLYRRQQVENLNNDNIYSIVKMEYENLMKKFAPNDVELFLTSTTATLLINVRLDITSLPQYTEEWKEELSNPGEDICLLKIVYVKLDGSKINTNVQLSPRLRQVLSAVSIPAHSTNTVLTLAKYIATVANSLQEQIDDVKRHYKLKNSFMDLLRIKWGNSLYSYDTETYTTATRLCDFNGHFCPINLEIGPKFPKEKPTVTVGSFFCVSTGKLCREVIDDYPYSPRWPPELMLQRLMEHLKTAIPEFQNHKH